MIYNPIREFLFRCEKCSLILSAEFSDKEDIEEIEEDNVELDCPCGSVCRILRD
jgi:hypothetical protein